jgi:hypothetical protein
MTEITTSSIQAPMLGVPKMIKLLKNIWTNKKNSIALKMSLYISKMKKTMFQLPYEIYSRLSRSVTTSLKNINKIRPMTHL